MNTSSVTQSSSPQLNELPPNLSSAEETKGAQKSGTTSGAQGSGSSSLTIDSNVPSSSSGGSAAASKAPTLEAPTSNTTTQSFTDSTDDINNDPMTMTDIEDMLATLQQDQGTEIQSEYTAEEAGITQGLNYADKAANAQHQAGVDAMDTAIAGFAVSTVCLGVGSYYGGKSASGLSSDDTATTPTAAKPVAETTPKIGETEGGTPSVRDSDEISPEAKATSQNQQSVTAAKESGDTSSSNQVDEQQQAVNKPETVGSTEGEGEPLKSQSEKTVEANKPTPAGGGKNIQVKPSIGQKISDIVGGAMAWNALGQASSQLIGGIGQSYSAAQTAAATKAEGLESAYNTEVQGSASMLTSILQTFGETLQDLSGLAQDESQMVASTRPG
ncbi:MAG TPA: hypothetical protein VJK54_05095 [Chthoniobacterales bacterium]|nr:hypothetical protein [Chthoniobacterales bacterium]